ncbi:MAG: 4'-phosphopantetheinyl transferase [Bacteroidetes bacterium SW_10_40_5]|nr:MAG: 4'-phosphopantetheinyl transferase [Bacteroidetes bacterium SW_10_40_5]
MPLVVHKKLPEQTQIGVWRVEENIEDLKKRLKLNEQELAFFDRLRKGKRNLHWLSSRVLIRNLLDTPEFIRLEGDEHGKPHLMNFDYELSISHSFDYAAVIISKQKVGIDIEYIKPKIELIAHKFMSDQELDTIHEEDRIKKMFVHWSGKESLYKLHGKKDMVLKENILLEPFQYKEEGIVNAAICKNGKQLNVPIHYQEFNGYMFTYVIAK